LVWENISCIDYWSKCITATGDSCECEEEFEVPWKKLHMKLPILAMTDHR
jgi:hypothetical protein